MAADAIDLAFDTAGTIGAVVGGLMGFGNSETSEKTHRGEVDNAIDRVAGTLEPGSRSDLAGSKHEIAVSFL